MRHSIRVAAKAARDAYSVATQVGLVPARSEKIVGRTPWPPEGDYSRDKRGAVRCASRPAIRGAVRANEQAG